MNGRIPRFWSYPYESFVASGQQITATFKTLLALISVARSNGDLKAIADLVDTFLDTPQMDECLRRCRLLPEGQF